MSAVWVLVRGACAGVGVCDGMSEDAVMWIGVGVLAAAVVVGVAWFVLGRAPL
jgi:uncharacterized transporter YbjL